VVPFQNCVRQRRPVSKMATITKNRNFFKWSKLLYFKPESAQIWTVQFWPFEEISIFSNGGHLGYRTALTDTILKGDHLRIISAKFGNCSILSQKVPKFELYKHNDEHFNIYYGIFKELWTFTDFNRLCKLEKNGADGHNFEREPPKDHFSKVWLRLAQ
jgi:hypothetical protein